MKQVTDTSGAEEVRIRQTKDEVSVDKLLCPICGSNNPQQIRENQTFDTRLVRCLDCGLFYSSPEVTIEPAAEHYRQGKVETWWQRNLLRKILSELNACDNNRRHGQLADMIDSRIGDGQSILDIGCGNAETLLHLAALGHHCVGIEPCFRQWDRIQGTGIKIYEDVFDNVQIKRKFDVVVLSHFIEHIPEPVLFLRKVNSLMTRNGLLFIETPNSANYYQRYYDMQQNDEHLCWYNSTNIVSLLSSTGFTEIAMHTYDCGDIQFDWVINRLLLNRKRKTYTGHHSVRIDNRFIRWSAAFIFEILFKYVYTRVFRNPLPFYIRNEEDKGLWVLAFSRKA